MPQETFWDVMKRPILVASHIFLGGVVGFQELLPLEFFSAVWWVIHMLWFLLLLAVLGLYRAIRKWDEAEFHRELAKRSRYDHRMHHTPRAPSLTVS